MQHQNYNAIRKHYELHHEQIMNARPGKFGISAYAWSDLLTLTPIEEWIWEKFRYLGMVMYPQYPVGRFFVDFGSPKKKVAIECDGAAYHLDKDADFRRQQEIQALGWKVFRFTGRECKQPIEDFDNYGGTTYGRLKSIAALHGLSECVPLTDELCADFLEYEAPRLAEFIR